MKVVNINPLDPNDPEAKRSILSEEMLFCETGTLLALNFSRTCNAIIEHAGESDAYPQFRLAMNEALDELLQHRLDCPHCNED